MIPLSPPLRNLTDSNLNLTQIKSAFAIYREDGAATRKSLPVRIDLRSRFAHAVRKAVGPKLRLTALTPLRDGNIDIELSPRLELLTPIEREELARQAFSFPLP